MTPKEIKAIRERLGLTQVQFAEKLGISASMVEAMEYGKRQATPGTVTKIMAMRGKRNE